MPLVDISALYGPPGPELDALASEIDHLLRTAGFLMIVGHRVPPELRHATREAARGSSTEPTLPGEAAGADRR